MQTRSFRKVYKCSALVVCPTALDKTYNYFKRFRLKYKVAEEVLNEGANGKAVLLTFQRKQYTAHAVMKILNKDRGGKERDNLFREVMVGVAINEGMSKLFPCFIRTFGAYRAVEEGPSVQGVHLKAVHHTPDIREACSTAGEQAILIEYVKGDTLSHLTKSGHHGDVLQLLFQMYYALSMLGDEFTHYDLHLKNVLVYRAHPEKCLAFEYKLPEDRHGHRETVRFECNYVAKIIDYGRSYFYDGRESSATIYRDLFLDRCDIRARGFRWLNPLNGSKPFFTTSQPNPKFDLRFFQYVKDYLNPTKKIHRKFDLTQFEMSRALIPPDFPLADYGGAECAPGDICDCAGARDWLGRVLPTLPDRFEGQEKFGDLHVHPDSPFIFTLA